ncbi:MAG: helix-turn-helix domain-containing protein [Bryobacteraceae bacterium]|nr:helix-turn-helix domain-containing protein [Bryobacteraceae bacterium]
MASTAALLEAISSPRRREILRLVWSRERTAGEIREAMPDVTFGAVSQQLKVLAEAGLVVVRSESRSRIYKANQEAFGELGRMLERMWEDKLWDLKLAAELEQTRRGPRPVPKKTGKG